MAGTGCKAYHGAVGRRAFLSAGMLSLPAILQARAMAGAAGRPLEDTAVIQYWLNGAASHFETYDPKPDAPAGIRGPFHPISTNIPAQPFIPAFVSMTLHFVPEPSTLLLVGLGVFGFAVVGHRQTRK